MKAGVPNLLLSSLDKFQWDRIIISQQNYIYFQIHEWMMGRFSVDFSCFLKYQICFGAIAFWLIIGKKNQTSFLSKVLTAFHLLGMVSL